ncbi:MAG: sigma-70 family RNA polymerase sigma factor, partial [Aquabacterium sp.]
RGGARYAGAAMTAAMSPATGAAAGADLEAAYAQTRRSLLAYLRRLSGDAQLAEDLMHDVMVKALTALGEGRGAPRNLAAWLHRVAHNAAMDHHRAQRPDVVDDDELLSIAAESGDAQAFDERRALESISQCLRPMTERLPDTYRDVVRASEFDGRPLDRIARDLGISPAAARQRASRGRRLLRDELQRCCRQLLAEAGLSPEGDVGAAAKGEAGLAANGEAARQAHSAPGRGCGCSGARSCN